MSRYTLMDYFSIYVEEWDSLLEEFLRHLAMTSFSVVLALIIADPLYGAARHGHSLSGRG